MANVFWPPKGGSAPETLVIADATTATAPDGIIEQHTTSGTAAIGFGITDAVELESAGGTLRRVMTDVTSLQSATDGAEYAQRVISLIGAGALSTALTLQWNAPALQLTLGSNGLRSTSTTLLELVLSGTSFMNVVSTTGVNFPFRSCTNRGAGVAAATTITLGTGGNVFPISVGTGTINSIVATNWQAGSRIVLECVSGITITNNVAGSGATILTNTGASIVTASTRAIPLVYNGTNWIVEG